MKNPLNHLHKVSKKTFNLTQHFISSSSFYYFFVTIMADANNTYRSMVMLRRWKLYLNMKRRAIENQEKKIIKFLYDHIIQIKDCRESNNLSCWIPFDMHIQGWCQLCREGQRFFNQIKLFWVQMLILRCSR